MRKLRALRQVVGESLAVAGSEINRDASTVFRWEVGEQKPADYNDVRRLAIFYLCEAERRAVVARGLARGLI